MSNFSIFFVTGIEHITDFNGIDHILFVVALCLRYLPADWKKLLVLVTAFTIGHSVTLALSTFQVIHFSRNWTEFLIALTILLTALSNLTVTNFRFTAKLPLIYFFALIFGLVHGLGFSTLLKSMLGREESIVVQLLAFNLGLEAGQLIIVAMVLFVSSVLVNLLHLNRRDLLVFVSGGIAAMALQMAIERFSLIIPSSAAAVAIQHRADVGVPKQRQLITDEKTVDLYGSTCCLPNYPGTGHSQQPRR